MSKRYKGKEWLEGKYVDERLTIGEIAKRQEVAPATIYYWLGKFDIDIIDRTTDKVQTYCSYCGKSIMKCPSRIEEHNFCCHEHYAKWLSENQTGEDHPNYSKRTVKCSYCGEEIERPKWHRERATNYFCDHECYSNYLKNGKVLTNCTNCGKEIVLSRYRYLQSENSFCSKDCYDEWHRGKNCYNWKGGISSQYRGPNWEQQRGKAIKRDNNTCQICGASGESVKLDVHHKIPFQDFEREGIDKDKDIIERIDYKEANKLDNLILLCDSCHRKVEEDVISIDE